MRRDEEMQRGRLLPGREQVVEVEQRELADLCERPARIARYISANQPPALVV
jgi:hypothetical protein